MKRAPPLQLHPSLAPRRKLRGQRRYFRRIHLKAAAFQLEPGPSDWWSFWHYHADWRGWGNRRWRDRREHLRALATVFRTVAAAVPRSPVPVQAWLSLDTDAGNDGVFLHSPNPNGDQFPFRMPGPWTSEGPVHELLAELLPGFTFRVAQWSRPAGEDEPGPRLRVSHVAYCPGLGVPLEGQP